jgi:hypothetical protein
MAPAIVSVSPSPVNGGVPRRHEEEPLGAARFAKKGFNMDGIRFDRLTRSLVTGVTRRHVLSRLGMAALGLGLLPSPEAVAKKKKKKKLKLNQFGCVNVGGKCRGKDKNCCSGVCQGKKPKNGKRDKSRCVAHDESTCEPGQTGTVCDGAADVPCAPTSGPVGVCFTTTGNAGYCSASGTCSPCQKDADCIGVCGEGAACVPCASECDFLGGTACVGASPGACGT